MLAAVWERGLDIAALCRWELLLSIVQCISAKRALMAVSGTAITRLHFKSRSFAHMQTATTSICMDAGVITSISLQ